MKRILRIGMDVHSTNYTLCAIEPRFDGGDTIYVNVKVTPDPPVKGIAGRHSDGG